MDSKQKVRRGFSLPPGSLDLSSTFHLRYLLAGIDTPPFNIGDAKLILVDREEPDL